MRKLLNLDPAILKELFKKAESSERKRANYILRSSNNGEIPAIMFNVLLPGTYLRPHRHPSEGGKDIWIPLSGRIKAIIFDESGNIYETYLLSTSEVAYLEIPPNTYHSLIVLEPAVLCELYMGVYNPTTYKEFASWAPPEENSNHQDYLNSLGR